MVPRCNIIVNDKEEIIEIIAKNNRDDIEEKIIKNSSRIVIIKSE